jgi:hypothetical protein
VFNAKKILVGNIGIRDKKESSVLEVIKFALRNDIAFDWEAVGITGENQPSRESGMWQRIVQFWFFPVLNYINCHISFYRSRRGFALVDYG